MDDTAWALLAVMFGAIVGAVIAAVINLIAVNIFTTSTERQPLNVLRLLAFITAAAILMGIIVPGTVAWFSGVFYQEGIVSIVKNKFPDAQELISIQPFYEHIIMYFWPIMYLCLGALVFLMSPPSDKPLSNVKHAQQNLTMTSIIFIFLVGHTIYRNIFLSGPSAKRVVYAYSNLDVAPASFTVQMTHFFIFSFLLATLWHRWSNYFAARVREIELNCFESALEATFDVHNLDRVSKELLRWQLCLGVLSTGFIIYTAIFWKQIILNGDLRFLIEAFFAHALWLISAVVMAMPFWATWRAWRLDRIRAIGELVHRPDSTHDLETMLSALRELRPVGSWNATTVIATVFSSIAAPLGQLLLKSFEVG